MAETYSPQQFHDLVEQLRTEVALRIDATNYKLHEDAERRQRTFPGPVIYPARWILLESRGDGEAWQKAGVKVIWSCAIEEDGEVWMHVSASQPHTELVILPGYNTLKTIKELFAGPDTFAYSVWPPVSEHVNINPGVLHLFAQMTGERAVPDFTRGLGTI